MKKLLFLVALTILLAAVTPVFAQSVSSSNIGRDSTFYYVNIPVEKVYPSNRGYVIRYRTQNGVATVGIPNSWFTDAAGKADYVTLPRGPNWPTLSVFYENGEFSHLRLYVHPYKGHISWGNIPLGADLSEFFSDDDKLNLTFK